MPIYTELPPDTEGHRGELRLANQLLAFNDPRAHFWFGLKQIPGVNDIDILLYHEAAGVFCIEVKAVSLNGVKEFGIKRCVIEGREQNDGPNQQAYRALESLWRYLQNNHRFQGEKLGYFKSTACWSRISRGEWKRNWNNPAISDLSERMLFEEDFSSGLEAFIERLKKISFAPPAGKGNSYKFRHNQYHLTALKEALDERGKKKAAPSDLEKLRVIENEVTRETRLEVPVERSSKLIYTGYPGTGKTFRLLQIAVNHAMNGKKVLYACFNQTLAADIRRLLSYSDKLAQSDNLPAVYDIFDMVRYYSKGNIFDDETDVELYRLRESEEWNLWGELLSDDMKKRNLPMDQYDTILIDEAQDMKNWAHEMLMLHAKQEATICVGAGSGQELYGIASEWLMKFRDLSETAKKRLRRNFRNTKPVFQVAQTAYETKLDGMKANRVIRRFTSKQSKAGQQELEFAREEGKLPSIVNIIEEVKRDSWEDDDHYSEKCHHHFIDQYSEIIREQIEALNDDQRPIDLLVLVPNTKGAEREWAFGALKKLGVPFIDYTVSGERRTIAKPEMVRLCTYHSSRGLEGQRVIVFGMESIKKLAEAVEADAANLAYIVLSRSTFECIICTRRSIDNSVIPFMENVLYELQSL